MSWFKIQFNLDNLVLEESDLAALFEDHYPVADDSQRFTQSDAEAAEKPLDAFFREGKT